MSVVKVRAGDQLTLPAAIRRKAGIAIGDVLDAQVKRMRITLTPKRTVERELSLALGDIKKGRIHGPFRSAREAVRSLRRGSRRPAAS